MKNGSPGAAYGGVQVVKHFVEDDKRNEVAGDPVAVENWVDGDEPFDGVVGTQFDTFAGLGAGTTTQVTPGDQGIHAVIEVRGIQLREKLEQIVEPSLCDEPGVHAPSRTDSMQVGVDVAADYVGGVAITLHNVSNERVLHHHRSVEEHVVSPHTKHTVTSGVTDHAVAIVCDGELDGSVGGEGDATFEHLPYAFVYEDLWLAWGEVEVKRELGRVGDTNDGRSSSAVSLERILSSGAEFADAGVNEGECDLTGH
jgi:hypothetical protein